MFTCCLLVGLLFGCYLLFCGLVALICFVGFLVLLCFVGLCCFVWVINCDCWLIVLRDGSIGDVVFG